MKKIILIVCSATVFMSCDQIVQKMAIKHNDAIVGASDKVVAAFDKLTNTLPSFNTDSINVELKAYHQQINTSIQDINKATFLNDSSLKVATKEMLHVFDAVGENEFKKISEIYAIPDSLYTTKEETEVKALSAAIDEKIEAAQTKQRNVQIAFAKRFNFALLFGKDTVK